MSIATTKRDILDSLKDREFRAAWNLENVYTTICFQLRALREQRELSQGAFGNQVKPRMAQERISILEDPTRYKPNFSEDEPLFRANIVRVSSLFVIAATANRGPPAYRRRAR